jgi:branched-chain amino acid transport system ATP-binding protein
MLEARGLCAGYGAAQVLFDVNLEARGGEVVALLGHNGAGKSTTLKTIMGLLPLQSGRVAFDGRDIAGLQPYEIARLGLGYVPEDRRIFSELTVAENLEVGRKGTGPWSEERLFALFPALGRMRGRRGGEMSGGEQQMLCIARTLAGNPAAVLLDEPSEGLAPVVVDAIAKAIGELKRSGLTVLLAEQSERFTERVADRAYRLEKGVICAA